MKRVMIVFGTRPEAIKMAPVVLEFKKKSEIFETLCCVTAQHREMLDQVLDIFGIIPDFDLNIMKANQNLFDITSKVLLSIRDVFIKSKPDLVIVHGDTTTSTVTALAAFYLQIPVAHVEAGLRTNNIYSPWPEEMNRQLTGRLATFHFAPTKQSKLNLLNEGVKENSIEITGNTVIDALFMVLNKIKNDIFLESKIKNSLISAGYDLNSIKKNRKVVLITGHRRENFGEGFISICKAIKDLCLKYPDVDYVYPMHLNPNVRNPINDVFGEEIPANMFFTEPLDYLSFIYLMDRSYLVLTDSGGIQEEAPSLGKPVLVMRNTTERPEALEAGTVKLVGTNYNKIVDEVSFLIDDHNYYKKISTAINPYGDGFASVRIVEFIKGLND